MQQQWSQNLISAAVDGAALSNTTTPTSLLHAGSKLTLPPNFLYFTRQQLRVRAAGRISTVVTSPGTLTLDVRLGSVVVFNGGAMTLSTTAKTNVTWTLDAVLTLRSVGGGTAATLFGTGEWKSEAAGATTVAGEAKCILLPQSAPAVGTGFDETAAQTVDLFGTWSAASASNSITCHQFEVWG